MPLPSTPLIDASALRAALASDDPPRVFDVGFDLADPSAGHRRYLESHLPGARYLHLDDDLSAPKTGRNGRHPLPERAAFAATLARRGVTPGRAVVVYDHQGAMYAARAWWMLRWSGHADVAVLDGGYAAWVAAGGSVERGDAAGSDVGADAGADGSSTTGDDPVLAAGAGYPTLHADELHVALGRRPLLDARAAERYRGDVEPLDARAGHIPGARNRPFKDNLGADGRFKPADDLRAEFRALIGDRPPETVIHQCGSGVTACHNLLAMEAAGLAGSALFPGSWSEWSADPARPAAIG